MVCLTHLYSFHEHLQLCGLFSAGRVEGTGVACESRTRAQFPLFASRKTWKSFASGFPKTYLKHNSVASLVLEVASLQQWFCRVCLSQFLPWLNRLRKKNCCVWVVENGPYGYCCNLCFINNGSLCVSL